MVFELFLVILETNTFLVSLAKTLRLLDLNLPLTCAQRRRYLQKSDCFFKTNSTLIRDIFVSNCLRFFSEFMSLALVLFLYCLSKHIFSILF
jgi:hypothetical protein